MIPAIERVIVVPCLFVVSVSSYTSVSFQGGVFTSLLFRVSSVLLTFGLVVYCPSQDSRGVLCVSCVVRCFLEEAK